VSVANIIFVVDDDPAVLRSLERLLNASGFVARTFDSADAFCASAIPDDGLCLVLDINLGGSSGIELSRRLTASGSLLPVIFITGNDTEHLRNEAIQAGCIAYLKKPFASLSLLDAIKRAGINRAEASHKSRL
jgi:FixJ family two-component response regulator